MVSEEIGLNEALEHGGIRAIETDLGEWVCQLAGQRPSHLLAPIVHMDRREVADVLSAEAGELIGDDPATMVAWARTRLRATFLDAGIGITGANFLVAETGTAIVLENEGNGRLVSSLPRCHVVVVGIEKLVDRLADAAFLIEQLSLVRHRARAAELRLPDRESRAGRRRRPRRARRGRGRRGPPRARGHALRGRALVHPLRLLPERLPGLRQGRRAGLRVGLLGADRGRAHAAPDRACDPDQGRKLPSLSSLCGACTEVCPVGIPLHDLLVRDRAAAVQAGETSSAERTAWRAWSLAWSSPRRYRASARAASLGRVARARAARRPPRGGARTTRCPRSTAGRSTPAGPRSNGTSDDRRLSRRRLGLGSDRAARADLRRRAQRPSRSCSPGSRRGPSATGRATRSSPRSTLRASASPAAPVLADAGITGAERGIASTGTLLLTYGEGRGRSVGLLPDVHIAVLAADRIVADLPTALALAYAGGGPPPAAVTLVTGPSASSDIEKIRVTGVHGPRRLGVVVVG